jgi:signal transduction histidine kinase/ActR/RegA family two-component response regulator
VFYRQARVVFVPNAVAVPAIVYALYGEVQHPVLLSWFAYMYLITAARALLVWWHGRAPRARQENRRWAWALTAANSISGAGWGFAGFVFVAGVPPLSQALVVVTIAAMASGAVSSLAAYLPAYVAFVVPCVTPLALRMFARWSDGAAGSGTYLMIGILALVYMAVHLFFARNAERTLTESIRLRFENIDLVGQLTREKERAEAASVAKTRFLAAASHDLRQPMHALGLFIDALRAEPHAPRARHLVDAVSESQLAATALLDNLLEFSRVESGSLAPAERVFAVQSLLDAIRHDFTVQASAADLELRVRPCGAYVRSDPVMLARLVGNLVSNAIRYTERGRVMVGCRRRGGHLWIEVHDTGVGIPAERQDDIFREFYQLDGGVRGRGRTVGMGLGLAIVAGLSQALDHPVHVESTLGRGSVFTVRVPVAQRAPAAEAASAQPGGTLAGHTILVIDDEPTIVEALDAILRRWGCEPLGASSAAEAIGLLRGGRVPSAIVVDAQLADGDTGVAAVASVRAALGQAVPVIMVTGDTDPARIREAADIGFPLLHKPLSPMRLRAALSTCIETRTNPEVARSA